jgi:hypothetical protein
LHLNGQEVAESSVSPLPVSTPLGTLVQLRHAPSVVPPTAQLVRYCPLEHALEVTVQAWQEAPDL